MNLFKKYFLFLILLSSLLITSCAEKNLTLLSRKENLLKSRADYNGYLSLEYLQFARNLEQNKSHKDSEYFADKGLKISLNQEYIPENPLNWDADRVQLEEIIAMQKRLELVLTPTMQTNLPIQMAHLSYLYDCWSAKESKAIFRGRELAKCRERFYQLLGEVEYYLDDLKKDKQPKTVIIEPNFKKFEIAFDLDSAKFNDKANKNFINILKYLVDLKGNYRLLVVGGADRTGSELYNQTLAFKRSDLVKKYLVKNGVPETSIEFRSFGEDFPDILTKDGTQDAHNRLVAIYVLTGADSFDSYPLPLIENFIYKDGIEKSRAERGLTN
ncbi:MAG: OmpA family protein [Rickettsiales bacterium]|nr:OmpA family protein [Rickettsiales bacterium]